MNKKVVTLITVILALVMISSTIEARQPRNPEMLKNLRFGLHMAQNNLFEARHLLYMKDEIGLTADQQKKIEEMMLAYEETAIRRQADLKILETRFAAMLNDEKIDRKQMEKMVRDISNLKANHQIDHLNYLLNIRDILTPDQLKKLEELRKNMRHGIRERFNQNRQRPLPPQK